ncbi:hypothetical protein LSH36_660g05032 [Paralvinella palmiformis]|uniref:Peptidase M12B domain-containing protein n=1 Tax=Paralvinella palmiformis TaxID=53620 RepID=A0AAD9J388_9ANNE|nr:hypothetical protein LSH36_660g05032 [Paralvinella palmiformis]
MYGHDPDESRSRQTFISPGLAELGTMCTPHKSCSIIEDNGLSSAFTVAHELGHVFSLPHDEHEVCDRYHQPNEKHQMKAMAGTLDHTMQPWSWSDCSRGYMAEFIESGLGECLRNRPEHRLYVKHVEPKCNRLWCQNKKYRTCITQHMPWADGTTCAPGAWCQRGVCIPRRQPMPIHGGWSSWTPYSNCTLPCAGGVKVSERTCDNPVLVFSFDPRNGGSFCTGAGRRYKSCNIQCAKFNGKWYNINGLDKSVRWLPKYTGVGLDERCKLICRANGTAAFYPLSRKVIDGTKCGLDTSDMCINGKCVVRIQRCSMRIWIICDDRNGFLSLSLSLCVCVCVYKHINLFQLYKYTCMHIMHLHL